jgi:hypothetical protein
VSLTIIRHDLSPPLEFIVGQDIDADQAEALVASGAAELGPDYELPPAVYLQHELTVRGAYYPPGTMLHVGGEIDESEALLLIRGAIATGESFASIPAGGIG